MESFGKSWKNLATKKRQVPTKTFSTLWEAFVSVLRTADPNTRLDLHADITNSCRIVAQYLREHPATHYDRGDSTIYKNLLRYVQAHKQGTYAFEINGPLLNALTAVVHGEGATYEKHYDWAEATAAELKTVVHSTLDLQLQQTLGAEEKEVELNTKNKAGLGSWLQAEGQKGLKYWVWGGGLLLGLAILLESSIWSAISPLLVLGIELVWLLGISLLVFRQPSVNAPTDRRQLRALQAVRRFWNYWLLLWLAWFVFYLFLFGAEWLWRDANHPIWMEGLLHFLNNGSALCLGLMYLELSERTSDSERHYQQWYPFLLIWVLLGGLEWLLLSLDPNWMLPLAIFSGVLGGGAMALFVSRFSSKVWDVPRGVIVCLVGYAIIQPSLPFITQSIAASTTSGPLIFFEFLAVFLLIYAFVGKILLLLVVQWLRNTQRLRYYMLRLPLLQAQERQLMEWGVERM